MIEIQVDPPGYRQPRHPRSRIRGSGVAGAVLKIVFFLASLIPACIVAYRIDLLGLHPPQQVVQVQQLPVGAAPLQLPQRRQPPAVRRSTPRKDVRPTQPRSERLLHHPIVPAETAEPVPAEKAAPRPHQSIALDLTGIVQREVITLAGNLRVVRILGCTAEIEPQDGTFPVRVTLSGPRPVAIKLSLIERDGSRMLLVEPRVTTDAGKEVPYMIDNLNSIGRRTTREGRRAAAQLASMQSEQARLSAWIKSPVLKPLAKRNQAVARVNELAILIPEGQRVVAALEADVQVTRELVELARRLHGTCTIVVESANGDNVAVGSDDG